MKKILSFMAYALLAAALPSCGSDKDDPEDPEKPDATVAVQSISASYDEVTLTVGDDAEPVAYIVSPEDATDKSITVKSSDEAVCTVEHMPFTTGPLSGSLDITPVGEGTATVTLTSKSNPKVSTTIQVTVKAKGEEEKPQEEPRMKYVGFYVTYPDRSHKMFPATGGTAEAQAGTELEVHLINGSRGGFTYYPDAVTGARWESTNTSVATIADAASTSRNTITLRAVGATTIRVTAPDGSQSSFTLTVKKPSVNSRFAITGTDGKKYLLTSLSYINDRTYPVEYDDDGELKTIDTYERISEGRFRDDNTTFTLTFKSGTNLLEKLEIEQEGSSSRHVMTYTFSYDASGCLLKETQEWYVNNAFYSRDVYAHNWSSDKYLGSKVETSQGGGRRYVYNVLYNGNTPNPLRQMGIAPIVWSGIYTNFLPLQVWGALSALGCFGKGSAVLPTGQTWENKSAMNSSGSYSVECTLNDAGLLTKENYPGGFDFRYLLNYNYEEQ